MGVPKRAVVVGAGFGGLGAAILLARQGMDVTLLEKNSGPGGRAMVYRDSGFTFDMGPSWYLMPDIFDRFFESVGERVEDHYTLRRLDPSYRIFFGPGDYVDLSSDLEANIALFEGIEPGSGSKFREYLRVAEHAYDVSVREFLYKDYRTVFDFLNRRTMMEGRDLHVLENLDRYTRRFFASERLRRILEYSMVFLGGSPRNTPALYSLLSHVDFNLGVWYPEGGIGAVVHALRDIACANGVKVEFGREVTGVVTRRGRAAGVRTRDGEVPADVVVMNADYAHAELDLLDSRHRSYSPRYWERRTLAPSAFMMYLGVRGATPGLLHHTLSFQHDWIAHFDSIFKSPAWPANPSLYVNCPSKTDPNAAPEGHEAVTVLVPVAPGLDDNEDTRAAYEQIVMREMEALLGEPLEPRIVTRRVFGPADFAGVFNAYKGTALGLSHTLMQSAAFRPRHRSRKVRGLYYTGQYTHPGIGMPMALIASTVVCGLVKEDAALSGIPTRIFRRGSATFYNSSRLFPPDVRARVTALYAFVRVADDFVDADPQDRDGFAAFRAEYEAARRGVPARSPVIAAFLNLSRERGFEDAWVDAFLDAMAQDIWKTEYATLEETLAYVYGSAEVVGLMMSRLLGLPPAAEPSARLLGRAFQYVNFVRDLHEDFGLGRTYLPREDLQAAGLPGLGPEAALAHPQAFRAFVAGQINRYRTYACVGMEGFRFIPRETLAPIRLAAEMYEHTARVIERDPFVVYRRKVKPTRTRLLLSAGRQILRRGIPGHPGPDPMGQAAEGHDAPA